MTQHDDAIRLRHMLDAAQEAVEMVQGRDREELEANRMLQLALIRLVEVVGEAAARISPDGQKRYQAVPLRQAQGMRNRLIHGYGKVDLDILWDTVQEDLPALIKELEQTLG